MRNMKNRYLGIDLGTTNSCVAYGEIEAYSNLLTPKVFPIRMAGVPAEQLIVPSVVMYKRGESYPTVVGISAKQQLLHGKVDPDSVVVRSVKLQMGKKTVEEAPWLTPEQVSAHILRELKGKVERILDKQTDVVIGVPACFDVDKWRATERAAEIAGFTNVKLIDEPKAILLDFIHTQSQIVPENRVLDFSRPRIICIFDPGGGTVDVSVVRVQQTPVNRGGKVYYEMQYDDLGLTRQPFLGGDDFDRLLAEFLESKFALQTGVHINTIPDVNIKQDIKGKILEYAEDAKKNLSDQVMNLVTQRGISEEKAIEYATADIAILHLYHTYGLSYHLTYREYSDIVASLLEHSLQLYDIERPDIGRRLAYQEEAQKSDNVIFPIYDAILKAKKELGTTPHIDAVLISGGMSKLQLLRHRLQEFFGHNTPIIEVQSPDLSVAKGATLHHYNLVHGLDRTSNRLPEAISLEVGGDFVTLVPANTQYPTATPIVPSGFQLVLPRSEIPYVDVPLWRGERPRPSAKLMERRIDLRDHANNLREGDLVDIQVTIDANRHLKFEAWLHRNPGIRFEVTTAMM